MRIAIYAGSFDPITRGHFSVIEGSARAFDELIVLVADNHKKKPLFTVEERQEFIRHVTKDLNNVTVAVTSDLVVQYARKRQAQFLIRGIRDAMDTEEETLLANVNRALAPEITTFFVPADPNFSTVSSTRLKEMAQNGENGAPYCVSRVWSALQRKLGGQIRRLTLEANCDL